MITIQCDNLQTIRLINSDIALLQTKLRHVDIHNHWLRQEAIEQRIAVVYTPTDSMIADGLTKTLTARKHVRFTKQMGLVDIKGEIDRRRRLEKLSEDFFDDLEDSLEGGEAEVVHS